MGGFEGVGFMEGGEEGDFSYLRLMLVIIFMFMRQGIG